jgi:hypothetical protein
MSNELDNTKINQDSGGMSKKEAIALSRLFMNSIRQISATSSPNSSPVKTSSIHKTLSLPPTSNAENKEISNKDKSEEKSQQTESKWCYIKWREAVDSKNNNEKKSPNEPIIEKESPKEEKKQNIAKSPEKTEKNLVIVNSSFKEPSTTLSKLSQFLTDLDLKEEKSLNCCNFDNDINNNKIHRNEMLSFKSRSFNSAFTDKESGSSVENPSFNQSYESKRHVDSIVNDRQILDFFQKKKEEWKKYKHILIDSHCHLDILFNR